ncbi:U32 family peptidase [Sinanaerobacter chloroacetimidivorans]|uniref:U32 family peptidase n=1 Tax=Sinanaerobacter chloroacetimidivorans TaxID=2818044 RepID=A0A8J7VXL1_9FIRM|nr:U32 family peptidase [Sinanaerobacter chloroacetimidivorans]MBR0596942.1 U32 family peptidase [Sinanaerobacter chloroacetimidivorans]
MTELLAPAGNMEALKAAISNGCDAIYLGMQKFGARAYSSNFDLDSLKEAVTYAHLRNVKIYVTMNTIVFENEAFEMKEQMHQLNEIGVDGIIVQDLAAFDYMVNNFLDMEVHCSTQMGIDDLDGTLLLKELGANRVVLAREIEIEKVKEIKRIAKIPLEIFVHGALCVSYSGNCLMSGLIGYRSGNRGRCVGSCRKEYELIDKTTDTSLGKNYILSTKDLNTIDYIDDLKEIDSLKIEGRMKEPAYVANAVSKYRMAIDNKITEEDKENLNKTFNRTFTKGYLFHEDKKDITNILRPNNFGYEIGRISKIVKDMYEITLTRTLNQNDIIRISHNNEDVNLTVVKLYDKDGNLINKADAVCYIKIKEKLSKGDFVYITKEYFYYKELESSLEKEFKRFNLDIRVYAYPDSKLIIDGSGLGFHYVYESEEILGVAINNPTTKEQVIKQFSRLNDTIFELNRVDFEECNAFIPAKLLNAARRDIVQGLYDLKLNSQKKRTKALEAKEKISFASKKPYLTASVTTQEQYEACVSCGIKEIYFENVVRRNQNDYKEKEGQLLIGGYGGIYHYRKTNPFVADYSLNVVNSASCYELYRLGAKRVTLSYELNKRQIEDLINAYYEENDGYPALEMIVYGKAPLMFTKYCPLKKMNQCATCRTKSYELKDEHGTFPIISHDDCTTTILNGKTLNLLDELPSIKGIEAFRLNFTVESKEEVVKTIHKALSKLNGSMDKAVFRQETDTRGHFNKEIL